MRKDSSPSFPPFARFNMVCWGSTDAIRLSLEIDSAWHPQMDNTPPLLRPHYSEFRLLVVSSRVVVDPSLNVAGSARSARRSASDKRRKRREDEMYKNIFLMFAINMIFGFLPLSLFVSPRELETCHHWDSRNVSLYRFIGECQHVSRTSLFFFPTTTISHRIFLPRNSSTYHPLRLLSARIGHCTESINLS